MPPPGGAVGSGRPCLPAGASRRARAAQGTQGAHARRPADRYSSSCNVVLGPARVAARGGPKPWVGFAPAIWLSQLPALTLQPLWYPLRWTDTRRPTRDRPCSILVPTTWCRWRLSPSSNHERRSARRGLGDGPADGRRCLCAPVLPPHAPAPREPVQVLQGRQQHGARDGEHQGGARGRPRGHQGAHHGAQPARCQRGPRDCRLGRLPELAQP